MRFVRNIALKEHLNSHYEKNLSLKRKTDRNLTRDPYQSFSHFVTARNNKIKDNGKYFSIIHHTYISLPVWDRFSYL